MTAFNKLTLLTNGCSLVFVALILLGSVAKSPVAKAADNTDSQVLKSALFNDLATAETESHGRAAEAAIWQFWFDQAPTKQARESLDAGMKRREAYDFEAAENHLDEVVHTAPLYAEGYNQRAFVRFLRENYSGSQDDLEKALELEPNHFGAMSGLYHILRIENRQNAALRILTDAVAIHPWLKERNGLPKELWPDSYREIHEGLKL